MQIPEIISIVSLAINFFTLVGVVAAVGQLRAAQDSLKAQTLLRMIDEWRNASNYRAFNYINSLRKAWKEYPIEEWGNLATSWVAAHANMSLSSDDTAERKLAEEWMMRREASQMISKMGLLVSRKYLEEKDLFGVDPEMGRQMMVIIAIDLAIQDYFRNSEKYSVAPWDTSSPKWELGYLWPKYKKWYKKTGHRLFTIKDVTSWSEFVKAQLVKAD